MKLLFDQHLAGNLVTRLGDLFPESSHVKDVGIFMSDDRAIWNFARENGFAIVSKDSDFQQLSLLYGAPPKVVWLKVGNCPTSLIEKLIRDHSVALHTFAVDPIQSLLVLG